MRVSVEDVAVAVPPPSIDALALDEALHRLAARDPRRARIVQLKDFGGMTIEDIAEVTGTSPATVKRDWVLARAWLRRELHGYNESHR